TIDVRMAGSTGDIRNNIIDKSINDREGGTHTEASNQYLPTPTTSSWFVDVGSHDMHLLSGSPAVDTGQALAATLPEDFSGTARPCGSAYDVGAFEYVATPPPPVDAGIADSGVIPPPPDAGIADSGVVPPLPDAGIADTGIAVDAGLADSGVVR